jgi:hypothetical protein
LPSLLLGGDRFTILPVGEIACDLAPPRGFLDQLGALARVGGLPRKAAALLCFILIPSGDRHPSNSIAAVGERLFNIEHDWIRGSELGGWIDFDDFAQLVAAIWAFERVLCVAGLARHRAYAREHHARATARTIRSLD